MSSTIAPDTRKRIRYSHDRAMKPRDVEEYIDYYGMRKVAIPVVRTALRLPVSPNTLTFFGACSGISSGFALGTGTGWPGLAGLFLFTTLLLDCADGQMARTITGGTRLGRLADGVADYITAVSIHVGLLVYLLGVGEAPLVGRMPWWVTSLAVVVGGVSMALHCGYFDQEKNRFLRETGLGHDETESPDEVREVIRQTESMSTRLLLHLYIFYCAAQASDEPPMRSTDVARHTSFLRKASFIGPSIHLLTFVAFCITSVWWETAFWLYLFIVIAPGNAYMWWVKRLGNHIPREPAAGEAGCAV